MRKQRILFCTESSFLSSGYANYTRELLTSLSKTGKYDLAEMASYGDIDEKRAGELPWKFYGVVPREPVSSEEDIQEYKSRKFYEFGELSFEKTCLDFLPDIVCDIRDFWMVEYQSRSPLREYFKWCIMPTVDAAPQASQWIQTYSSADACLTYTDWAGKLLNEQSGGKIDYRGSAPPIISSEFKPIDKKVCREELGIDPDIRIIGTVMRNQRRKLYPDLFKSFQELIKDGYKDLFLYCHVGYPDQGWDIPELLNQYNLSSRVLFTYVCRTTKKCFSSTFRGPVCKSPFTGKYEAVLPSVGSGATEKELAKIINSFDIYVQYANSEGFGIPQIEAAACAVPVMNIAYSGMEDVAEKIGAWSIKPLTMTKESETGCERAIPDNDSFVHYLKMYLDDMCLVDAGNRMRKAYLENYRWETSVETWEKCFDSFEIINSFDQWKVPPKILDPFRIPSDISKLSVIEAARWLMIYVLREPERCGTFFEDRLVRDLTYANKVGCTGDVYFNESSAAFDGKWTRDRFNFESAYREMYKIRMNKNHWEAKRIQESVTNEKLQKVSI